MAYFRRVYFSSILRVGLVAALRIVSSCTTCVLHFRFETSLALLHSAHKTCFDINFTLYTGFRCGFFLASFDFVSYICVCVFFFLLSLAVCALGHTIFTCQHSTTDEINVQNIGAFVNVRNRETYIILELHQAQCDCP